MNKYLPFVKGTYMTGLVYRFSFVFSILGNLIYLGVAYYLWKSIYRHADTLNGMTFDETFLYVALGSAIFILLKTYADWFIHYEIREGTIAVFLTKPLDYQIYNLAGNIGSFLLNLTAISLPTLLVLLFVFKVHFTAGPGLFLFPVSLVLALLVSFALDYLVGLMGFYSESIWGISTTKEIIVSVLSGALLPLPFFPEWIQKILFWLPFQAIYHTPLTMITRPNVGLETLLPMLSIQLVWTVLLLGLGRLFYYQAIKVLRIAGG